MNPDANSALLLRMSSHGLFSHLGLKNGRQMSMGLLGVLDGDVTGSGTCC